jgi:hypothetical protein
MRLIFAALLLVCMLAAGTASAQTRGEPLAPPVSPPQPPAPSSTVSPILTRPSLAQRPFLPRGPGAPAPAATAPIDQQKMQSYRNDLVSQQRALESQGIGLGSEQYRAVQQQLNQLNGSSR